jgi:hypothetical protein
VKANRRGFRLPTPAEVTVLARAAEGGYFRDDRTAGWSDRRVRIHALAAELLGVEEVGDEQRCYPRVRVLAPLRKLGLGLALHVLRIRT